MVKILHFQREGTGSIPGPGTKIPPDVWHGQKIKQNKNLAITKANEYGIVSVDF